MLQIWNANWYCYNVDVVILPIDSLAKITNGKVGASSVRISRHVLLERYWNFSEKNTLVYNTM